MSYLSNVFDTLFNRSDRGSKFATQEDLKVMKGQIMATVAETLTAIEASLDEAGTEILAEIEKLRGSVLDANGIASLDRIAAKAKALADVVPNTPPPTV